MEFDEGFDYVVVGAGSAGSVLAARLLETTGAEVLLLEAGGPGDAPEIQRTDVPTTMSLWSRSDVVWQYATVPQPELAGRSIPLPQGRCVGGGSAVNAMMYIRGNRRDFDHWNQLGNAGWSYEDVLPYFRKSEDAAAGDPEFHGTGGPLSTIAGERRSPVAEAFVAAAAELGFAGADQQWDCNAGRQEDGAFFYPSTRGKDHQRCSTRAFLRPWLDDPRLTLRTDAPALRVLVQRGTAVGVAYLHEGRRRTARARSRVVLAAGALASPKLLMLSGIGPAEELRAHGIDVAADLPGVGRNLQDHLWLGVAYQSLRDLPAPELLSEAGLFTRSRPGIQAASPDLQFFFGPMQAVDERYQVPGPGFTFAPVLAQPRSRGAVTLRSADPADLPVVDPRYLESPADRETLVRGIELARELAATRALRPYRGRELAPGGSADRGELLRYVRENATTVWHPVGTCRMGPDAGAVVDERLAVRGVDRLVVADASVMPTIPAGNTNATAVMIGEKCAALLAEEE